jgi:putative ABC transport system permease protein
MGVLWHKVWYDLWHHKGRSLLSIFSVAAGVFAIGAIFGMVDQMLSGMDQAHQDVFPSHINMILRVPVGQEVIDDLKTIDGVEDIDPVNQLTVRYKTDPSSSWETGTLMMREDYDNQTFDQITLKEGQWPSGEEIAVERLTSQNWSIGLQDELIFDINGETKEFNIAGLIRHPFVQPPAFGGQAHFFSDAEVMEQFGIPRDTYMQLLVRVDSYNLERAKEVSAALRSRLAEQGYGIIVTLYQDPERHWGRSFVEGVYVVLRAMAVVSLFLSVVLILNTFTALITQQTDQIGIIKSLGGKRSTLLKMYLAGALFFGLAALIIALPLSALMAWGTSQWFLNLFNIDYENFQISWRAIAIQVSAGIIAPLIAAFWPVWRGANMPVRAAIATYGLGADFGTGWFDRMVERLGSRFLSSPYAIALGNLFRRKGRLVLTLMVLTTAGVTFLIVMTLITSTQLTLDNEMARRGYDLHIGFMREQDVETVLEIVNNEPEIGEAELWYGRNVSLLNEGERLEDSAGLGAQLIGLPPETRMLRPLLVSGRWLEEGDDRAVLISLDTAEKNDLQVGDRVTLNLGDLGQDEWQVVGIYGNVLGSGFTVEPVYAPLDSVLDATGQTGKATQLYVIGNQTNPEDTPELADRLKEALEAEGIKVDIYTTATKVDERLFASNQFATVINVLINLAVLMAFVGGIGLMGALGISVMERRREIGVMRSIGARGKTLAGLYIMEGALQGLISWVLSLPLSFVLAQPLSRLLGQAMLDINLDYAYNWSAVAIWLASIISLAILMSLIPARAAATVSVRENLSYA